MNGDEDSGQIGDSAVTMMLQTRLAAAVHHSTEWLHLRWRVLSRGWGIFWRDIWRENIPNAALAVLLLIVVASVIVGLIEHSLGSETQRINYGTAINAFYWSVVTLATVGYGDIAPQSQLGRALTSIFILMGVATISVFTATLASVFTAKKIKEGRGLEKVKAKDHVVLCGWSRHIDTIMKFLSRSEQGRKRSFVLVNAQPEGEMSEVLYRYDHLDVHLVHGDFVQGSVLRRANVEEAFAAIILTGDNVVDPNAADNRTLQAALAIKSLNPDVKVVCEALNPDNEQHLRRANVDDVIVSGEFSGYLLGASTASPGLHLAIRELFSVEVRNDLLRNPIPEQLRGKTFAELHAWFRKQGALCIGIIVEERRLNLDDVLVDDFSAIDRFIRSAFSAAGKELAFMGRGRAEVIMNPPDDRVSGPNDDAILIAPKLIPV